MGGQSCVPELTSSEQRLLPLLTTTLGFNEIARALEVPRDAVQADALEIYRKLGLERERG